MFYSMRSLDRLGQKEIINPKLILMHGTYWFKLNGRKKMMTRKKRR